MESKLSVRKIRGLIIGEKSGGVEVIIVKVRIPG